MTHSGNWRFDAVLIPEEMPAVLSHPVQRLAAPRAEIEFYVPASRGLIDSLSIDPGIGAFCGYRKGKQQQGLLREIAGACDGYVALAVADGMIVGYLLLCSPGPLERWHGLPGVYELSIEVSRGWRQLGIAHRLLQLTFADPVWETRVVVSQGYSWHWDADYMGLLLSEYREMFRRLFETYGFAVFGTDDPEICFCRTNILMARVGTASSPALRRRFYQDLYRTLPRPAWLETLLSAA